MTRAVAITGAYGYLGTVIRREFDAQGWRTVALVRTPRGGDDAVAWALGGEAPEATLRGCQALVHCAYDFSLRKEKAILRVNVQGSTDLLSTARRLGVQRMIVLSSMSAYCGTAQVYGKAKLRIEEAALALEAICVRPGLVYGKTPAGITGALIKLTRFPIVPLIGARSRQFPVHEQDLALVIARIMEAPRWTPEIIGVAQPEAVSFRQFLAWLARQNNRRCLFLPVPWRGVYLALRLAEAFGASLPLRSDSVVGLIRPAPEVPRSLVFPALLDTVRRLQTETVGSAP